RPERRPEKLIWINESACLDHCCRAERSIVYELSHMRGHPMEASFDHGEALCPTVLDGISDSIIVIDDDYNIVYGNRAVQKKADECGPVGRKCYTLLHGAERPCTPCPCLQTFKDGKPNRIFRQSEGPDAFDFNEFRSYPISDENGRVTRVIEVIQEALQPDAEHETRRKSEKRPPLSKEEAG